MLKARCHALRRGVVLLCLRCVGSQQQKYGASYARHASARRARSAMPATQRRQAQRAPRASVVARRCNANATPMPPSARTPPRHTRIRAHTARARRANHDTPPSLCSRPARCRRALPGWRRLFITRASPYHGEGAARRAYRYVAEARHAKAIYATTLRACVA